ncbi:MAG: DUF4388 domain-containing protein [Acidobacteriota bacterium]
MSPLTLLLLHSDPATRATLADALTAAGHRVMDAASSLEAWRLARGEAMPDAAILHFSTQDSMDDWVGGNLRADAATRAIPIVVLTARRRDALRAGFADLVGPPYESEDIVLTLDLVLRESQESDFSGDLDKMSMPDLLQATVPNGRSGRIDIRCEDGGGTVWFADGHVIDATTDGGLLGSEAAYALVTRTAGDFRVDIQPVDRPHRINLSLSYLLLEAMRRHDEAQEPPHAGLPEEPPAPTRADQAVHLALLLGNVSTSWMSDLLRRPLLARRLLALRDELTAEHPQLEGFTVDSDSADIAWVGKPLASDEIDPLVDAVAAWLHRLYAGVERSMPGRFSLERLAELTGTHRDSLREVGFARAFAWSFEETNTATGDPA